MDYGEIRKHLASIGLGKNEVNIYLALLRLGSSMAGKISRECLINRTTTYDALRSLMDRGLVTHVVKSGRKWFEPVGPERFLDILREKQTDFETILPFLKQIHEAPKKRQDVTLHYGIDGMKSIFNDMARSGEEIKILDSDGEFTEKMPYFAPNIAKQLAKAGTKVRQLSGTGHHDTVYSNMELRRLDKKNTSEAVIHIYGDKVAILLWKEPPEGIVIEGAKVAEVFGEYFEMLWAIAKKEKKGKKDKKKDR